MFPKTKVSLPITLASLMILALVVMACGGAAQPQAAPAEEEASVEESVE